VEPILTKQEIEDLLKAIREGRVSTDIGDKSHPDRRTMACQEVDLFKISNKRDDQLRIPNFDIILDAFAQNYSISLSNQLQRTFSIFRTGLESMPFQEYMLAKENPGSIGVFSFTPLKHGALILYDPELSFSVVEIMLGAAVEHDKPKLNRNLTKIELTVLKATMSKACDDLDRAFRPITSLDSTILKVENNPRLVSITDPESEVIIGTFTVSVGDLTGIMELVFPLATLEPLRENFKELLSVNTLRHGGWTDILTEQLQEMSTTIIAQSGVLNLSIGEVMALKKGDVIPIDYDINSALKVLVEEKLKFFAQPGTHQGKKAISLISVFD